MSAAAIPLKFQLGARTLVSVRRRLVRVPVHLPDAIAGTLPPLPPLADDADGYLVTSLAAARLGDLAAARPALFARVRQRYTRYHADLTLGADAYLRRLSGNTRSQLKRKARRLAEGAGGAMRIDAFRTPAELAAFHPQARRVSALTYQERLLGGGMPADAGFVARMHAAAAADRVRAWLLSIGDAPVAYLYCEAPAAAGGAVLTYDHVGHDPAYGELSPGSVLMLAAFRALMAEGRFRCFDFTEGEGQHKRTFATGGTECVDVLLLRRTVANRLIAAALAGFDAGAAAAKRAAGHPALKGLAQRVRRAS